MRRNDIVDSKDIVHLIENVKGLCSRCKAGERAGQDDITGGVLAERQGRHHAHIFINHIEKSGSQVSIRGAAFDSPKIGSG